MAKQIIFLVARHIYGDIDKFTNHIHEFKYERSTNRFVSNMESVLIGSSTNAGSRRMLSTILYGNKYRSVGGFSCQLLVPPWLHAHAEDIFCK